MQGYILSWIAAYKMMKVYNALRYSRCAKETIVKLEANGISWRGKAEGDPLKLDVEEIELKWEIERAGDGETESSLMVHCREGVA